MIAVVFCDREELVRIIDNIGASRRDGRVEMVVIDGGSEDGTAELLRSRAADVDYWISEKDAGIYDAMNKGVAAARGRYVIHINAGDTLLAIPWAHLPDSDDGPGWVSCQVREDWGIFQPRLSWVSKYANTNNHQGSFYRRDLHLGYKSDYWVFADFEHHLRLLRAEILPELVYEIVAEHKGGGISSQSKWVSEEARAVQENYGWPHVLVPRFMAPIRRYRAKVFNLLGVEGKIPVRYE